MRPLSALVLLVLVLSGCAIAPSRIEGADAWQPFELYTHCGTDKSLIEFDGQFWQAVGPGPLNDGSGNPPPGFGNPSDRGWIARIDDDTAAYESSEGTPLALRRLDLQPDVGMCL